MSVNGTSRRKVRRLSANARYNVMAVRGNVCFCAHHSDYGLIAHRPHPPPHHPWHNRCNSAGTMTRRTSKTLAALAAGVSLFGAANAAPVVVTPDPCPAPADAYYFTAEGDILPPDADQYPLIRSPIVIYFNPYIGGRERC